SPHACGLALGPAAVAEAEGSGRTLARAPNNVTAVGAGVPGRRKGLEPAARFGILESRMERTGSRRSGRRSARTASRRGRTRPGHALARSGRRLRLGPSAKDLVIISRTLTELAEFLAPPQESSGPGRVSPDPPVGARRPGAG